MKNGFYAQHWLTGDGIPEGGVASGRGFTITWQRGPLGRGETRSEPNGAFVEDVLEAVKERIQHYQSTKFECQENELAINAIEDALEALDSRTRRREGEGTEGTHEGA